MKRAGPVSFLVVPDGRMARVTVLDNAGKVRRDVWLADRSLVANEIESAVREMEREPMPGVA